MPIELPVAIELISSLLILTHPWFTEQCDDNRFYIHGGTVCSVASILISFISFISVCLILILSKISIESSLMHTS